MSNGSDTTVILADKNPWYILATLYGEQNSEEFDSSLHEKNRMAWSALAIHENDMHGGSLRRVGLVPSDLLTYINKEKQDLLNTFRGRMGDVNAEFPSFKTQPEFRDFVLKKWLSLSNFYLPLGVKFANVKFIKPFSMKTALVKAPCEFTNVEFTEEANFEILNPCPALLFKSCEFKNEFKLQGVSFSAPIIFNSCNYSSGDFRGTEFMHGVDFCCCTFKGSTSFHGVQFGQSNVVDVHAGFRGIKFLKSVSFANANFHNDVGFQTAEFKGDARFNAAKFHGTAKFQEAKFNGEVDFTNAEFRRQSRFDGVKLIAAVPKFFEAKLHQDTRFTTKKENWPKATSGTAQNGIEAYTRLRQIAEESKKPDDQHFFFRQEFRCKALIGNIGERLPIILFHWVSDFGFSIIRPISWLIGVWLLSALIYYMTCTPPELLITPNKAASLSFASTFKIFGFQSIYFDGDYMKKLPSGLQILSGVQTIAGFILLFFLGLGLRNRFRLH